MYPVISAFAAAAGPVANIVAPAAERAVAHFPDYAIMASSYQSLTIDLNTAMLFEGAQLIIDALSSPYLLIAGLGLGVAILSAIIKAVTRVRM
jgi:hypothetical protein